MLCKLFLALYSCIFHLLFLRASTNGDAANSTASCSSSLEQQCANLAYIPYPFGVSASCAASPYYALSNCASPSTQASWDSFSDVALGVVGAVQVIALGQSFDDYGTLGTSIQLSWNKSLIDLGYCALFSSKNLSFYNIPSSINLTRFPDSSGALHFSPKNTYLLFNCTHQFGSLNSRSVFSCGAYTGLCPSLSKTPCIQWPLPTSMKELMLQRVLDSFACSHFVFGVSSTDEFGSPVWSLGSVELIWTNSECEKCLNANGACRATSPAKLDYCYCRYTDMRFDFNTQACDDCHGGFLDGGLLGRLLHCNTGAKIGFCVATIVVVLGIFIVIVRRRESIRVGFHILIKVTIPIAINVLKKTLRKLQSVSIGPNTALNSIDFDGLTQRPLEYSYGSIASATKTFSSPVGEGGFGIVYKGTLTQASSHGGLTDSQQIAVKVLEQRSKHSQKQFLNEVVTIGRIHHVNVVRLLGFCMQEDHEMLVYEFVTNGSLDRWLFDKKERAEEHVLDWGQRYAIALGIARGLSYLHEECRHRTVHCDIKPQNILLDENMHPKIADFGLARLMGRDESKVLTFAKGTPGYMAPEFWMGGESELSTKFDVYSYGMVLLELISGQRNFRRDAAASHNISFPAMAFKAAMEEDLGSILDAKMGNASDRDGAQWHQIKTAVFVALWCIQDHPASRPSMSEVVKYLEGGAAVSEFPPQPNISIFSTPSIQQESCISNYQDDDCTPLSVGR